MRICVTGHRPGKLYGYDLSDSRWERLKKVLKKILIEKECTEAITGMALGVDTIFALAVLELKNEGYNIKLHCAIPCRNQDARWAKKDQKLYNNILKRADSVRIVSNTDYNLSVMQKRNEYMVNSSDGVIAVWDGSKSGTANCVRYAKEKERFVIYVDPNNMAVSDREDE